jgi:spermidine/putrescine transport system substrate-binding protein
MKCSGICIRVVIVIFWSFIFGLFLYSSEFWFSFGNRPSITVCSWPAIFDPELISAFEKQTGVKVNMSYYESNEELFLKLGNERAHGYDLIIPSDYAVQRLRQRNFLKKLDKQKLTFVSRLNPLLMRHYFDENNDYSIPYEWSVFVLGFNTECYKKEEIPHSWSLIFDPKDTASHSIIMTNDPYVAVPVAAFYLFGSFEHLTPQKIKRIESLLSRQKTWVEAYSDFRPSYYIASKNACIAVSSSSYMLQAMKEHPHIDFIVPKEGTLVAIESFAIPRSSNKEEWVYAFINFMMQPEHLLKGFQKVGFFPATHDALIEAHMQPRAAALYAVSAKEFKRFSLLRHDLIKLVLSEAQMQDLWIDVKG